jgi:hypothetical protein
MEKSQMLSSSSVKKGDFGESQGGKSPQSPRRGISAFTLFVWANSILLAGAILLVQSRVSNYSLPIQEVVGEMRGKSFSQPLALKQENSKFLQLAHTSTNTKVTMLVVPKVEGKIDPLEILTALREYQPNVETGVESEIFKFLRAQFDSRRAVNEGVVTVEKREFLKILVNKKDHYFLGIIPSELGEVAIVAFNPRRDVPVDVLKDLIISFPALG